MSIITDQRTTSRTEGSSQFVDYLPGEAQMDQTSAPTRLAFTVPSYQEYERIVNAPVPVGSTDYDPGENPPAPARPREDPHRWTAIHLGDYIPPDPDPIPAREPDPPPRVWEDMPDGYTRLSRNEVQCNRCGKTTRTVPSMIFHLNMHKPDPIDLKKSKKKLRIYPEGHYTPPSDEEQILPVTLGEKT